MIRVSLIVIALAAGQIPTLQQKPVIRLRQHQDSIPLEFGGHVLLVSNGPSVLHLPDTLPPALDAQQKPWILAVHNLGPGVITVVGKAQFSTAVMADHTVQIQSTGCRYIVVR